MNPKGGLIRLFPVPFRLIDGAQQFKKWQRVNAVARIMPVGAMLADVSESARDRGRKGQNS